MRAAVSYGLTFNCDPMTGFLDRPVDDWPVLLALTDQAQTAVNDAQRDAESR